MQGTGLIVGKKLNFSPFIKGDQSGRGSSLYLTF